MKNKMLSQSIADTLLSMITIEKRFSAGDKLPNENELSAELNVSRTTLREVIRILNLLPSAKDLPNWVFHSVVFSILIFGYPSFRIVFLSENRTVSKTTEVISDENNLRN